MRIKGALIPTIPLLLLFSACKSITVNSPIDGDNAEVIIYQTTGTFDGDDLAGSQANAQAACASSTVAMSLTCANAIEAMLGFSTFVVADIDDIPTYPDSSPIANIDGYIVADNFADLIDNRGRLFTEDGLPGTGMTVDNVWTGFLNNGATESTVNCNDWSSTSGNPGTFSPTLTAGTGNWQGASGCLTPRPLLCLCW